MSMVTVFRSFNPAEAQVIHSLLDAAQFHPEIANELANSSLGTGGILVRVPAEEADDARSLINAPPAETDPA